MRRRSWAAAAGLCTLAWAAAAAALNTLYFDVGIYLKSAFHSSGFVRFQLAKVDLSSDRLTEVIVYVTNREFCGSGGCTTLVLQRTGRGIREATQFRVLMRATLTRPPIRVLSSSSHGWRDIGVMVSGGGIRTPYEAVLRFDGVRYSSNPTVAPALRLSGPSGTTVIADAPR